MMNYGMFGNWYGQSPMGWYNYPFVMPFLPFVLPLAILDIILKAFALWRAARNGQSYWFVALILVNSVGILPVLYLLFFQRKSMEPKKRKS